MTYQSLTSNELQYLVTVSLLLLTQASKHGQIGRHEQFIMCLYNKSCLMQVFVNSNQNSMCLNFQLM